MLVKDILSRYKFRKMLEIGQDIPQFYDFLKIFLGIQDNEAPFFNCDSCQA